RHDGVGETLAGCVAGQAAETAHEPGPRLRLGAARRAGLEVPRHVPRPPAREDAVREVLEDLRLRMARRGASGPRPHAVPGAGGKGARFRHVDALEHAGRETLVRAELRERIELLEHEAPRLELRGAPAAGPDMLLDLPSLARVQRIVQQRLEPLGLRMSRLIASV